MLRSGIARHLLDHDSYATEREGYCARAQKLLKGCDVHFERSVKRLAINHAYVPHGSGDRFRVMCNDLRATPDLARFNELERSLRDEFPKCSSWLDWWKRPPICHLIFRAHQIMDETLRRSIPNSTNPVESLHWSMVQSTSTGHEVLSGLNALLLYTQRVQRQDLAVEGMGVFTMRLICTDTCQQLATREFMGILSHRRSLQRR